MAIAYEVIFVNAFLNILTVKHFAAICNIQKANKEMVFPFKNQKKHTNQCFKAKPFVIIYISIFM